MSVGGAVWGSVEPCDGGDTDSATGLVAFPNCCCTASWIRADKSAPHSGQANVTGWRTMSGVASKAYLPPQSHWIFMRPHGLGFSSTTLVPSGNGKGVAAGEDFVLPSPNRKFPPYRW